MVIPVKRPYGNRTLMRDVLLDYDMPWNRVHWKAIVSAYKHSPFFDIFEPELAPCYRKKKKYLLEWNQYLINTLLEITDTPVTYELMSSYPLILLNILTSGNLFIPKNECRDQIPHSSRNLTSRCFLISMVFYPI